MTERRLNGYHDGEDVVQGAIIGNYQIIRRLGQGGMGEVLLGEHTLLGRRAALKILLPSLSSQPEVIRRFFNEARAVTSISDPGIVQVFDFGYHTDGRAFLVMEYLEGETLEHRLSKLGALSVSETLRLARQLAGSLAEAHAQHIIHRDLKPENIYLVRDSEVAGGERTKILDFGIAKLSAPNGLHSKTTTGVVIGTPPYMSPEQCRGLAEIDSRSDIYSLGCVLFRMVTGGVPFTGEGPGDVLAAHIGHPPPTPSSRARGLPASVDALVLRCLQKAPADRFSSMTALTTAIGLVLRDLQLDDASPTIAHRRRAAPKRGRLRVRTPTTLRESSGQIDTEKDTPPPMRLRPWSASLAIGAAITGIALFARSLGHTEQAPSLPPTAHEIRVAPLIAQATDAPAATPSPSGPPVRDQSDAASAAKRSPPTARPPGAAVEAHAGGAKKLAHPSHPTKKSPLGALSPGATGGAGTTPVVDKTSPTEPTSRVKAAHDAATAAPPPGGQDASLTGSPTPDVAPTASALPASSATVRSAAPPLAESRPPELQALTNAPVGIAAPTASAHAPSIVSTPPLAPGAPRPATDQQSSRGAVTPSPPARITPAARTAASAAASPTSGRCSLAYFEQVYRDPTLTITLIVSEKQQQNKCLKEGHITRQERDQRHEQLQEQIQTAKP